MDPRKVAFIACVNNEALYAASARCIRELRLPPGFAIELHAVREAASMTEGYERARRESDAAYKVYMHQDVMLLNPDFIADFLAIVEADPGIGLIGLAGCARMPANGIWWEGEPLYGAAYEVRKQLGKLTLGDVPGLYQPVAAIDGIVMITQHELPWNTRIEGFHFYDTAHSLDFGRAGHRVVVAGQREPWALHCCGPKYDNPSYHAYRERFLELYGTTAAL